MENKINIAELLKDCPKGTKLYSPLVGECTLELIHGELKKILISTSDGTTLTFNNNGTYFQIGNSECLLFPSKNQRDWSKFQRPFKIGDKIKKKGNNDYRLTTIESINNNYYVIKTPDWFNNCYITDKLSFNCQDEYELVHSNKFDINTLKPFDKVLVRNAKTCVWTCDLYSHYSSSNPYNFVCTSNAHQQCIPYNDDTKYLLGTTNDCDEFYKNWK